MLLGGKNYIVHRMSAISGKKIAVGLCYIRPPLVMVARNVRIEGLMKADHASCSLSFSTLFNREPVFSRIVLSKPEIYYEIKPQKDKSASSASKGKDVSGEMPDSTATRPEKPLQVVLRAMKIKQGRLDIVDYRSADIPIKISARDVDINLDDSGLRVNASLPWNNAQKEGRFEAIGSFSPAKKEATAKLNINNIDGAAVYSYYSRWINLKEDGIQSARLDFASNISLVGNHLEAACRLELSDIVYKPNVRAFIRDKAGFTFNLVSGFTVGKLTLGNVDLIFLDQ